MRFWILALAVLAHSGGMPSSVAAQKRSAALSVRVTVVRSCSVNTSPATPTGIQVNCDSASGAMPRLSTSTFPAPASSAPEAVQSMAGAAESRVASSPEGVPAIAIAEGDSSVQKISSTEIAELVDDASAAGTGEDPTSSVPSPTPERVRVLTVNF